MSLSYRRTNSVDEDVIRQVILLADLNNKTLGFLPKSVIEEYCQNGNVFVCLDNVNLVGYILFAHVIKRHSIKIKHFCIDNIYRGRGIALKLFKEFLNLKFSAYNIELSCRDDYELSDFWHKIGFNIVNAKEGRATRKKSILHLFKLKLQKDINDYINERDSREKILLDSSIVFMQNIDEDLFLRYSDDIKFCIAPVIYDDMRNQKDEYKKMNSIQKANKIYLLKNAYELFKQNLSSIYQIFPQIKISDRKQIACAVTNKIKFFITNDKQLLGISHKTMEKFDITIFTPEEFYTYYHNILNRESANYEILPRMHGKFVDTCIQASLFADNYLNSKKGEKKHLFSKKFQNVYQSQVKFIEIGGKCYGIILYSINSDVLKIHILRFLRNIDKSIFHISIFILSELIQIAAKQNVSILHFDDEYSHEDTILASGYLGFLNGFKTSFLYIGNFRDYYKKLYTIYEKNNINMDINKHELNQNDLYASIKTEQEFFPAKFLDIIIPTYIIPIKSYLAIQLLFPEIETQYTLLQSSCHNVLISQDNVYFSGSNAKLQTPARILWYITKCTHQLNNTQKFPGYIVGTSYLNAIHYDDKSTIFKRFWKMGVYKWSDIQSIKSRKCYALHFSHTETFKNKIPLKYLKKSIKNFMNKGMTTVSVVTVTNDVFIDIYKKGFFNDQ